MEISEIIKKRRQELGLTLEDVAEALGVAKSTVLRYETKAINNMGIDKIEALSAVLKCTPAYLMGWVDDNDNWLGDGTTPEKDFKDVIIVKESSTTYITNAAAHATEDLNKEEQKKVLEYIKFLKSQRGEQS